MYGEMIAIILSVVSAAAVCTAIYAVRRVKRQILMMRDILREVKEGNGNRRILLASHELAAPLAYEINAIILDYEGQLMDYRQTEETNRQLIEKRRIPSKPGSPERGDTLLSSKF